MPGEEVMALDTGEHRAGEDMLTPMGIAHHTLFTAREKLDLLQEIRAEVTSTGDGDLYRGFSPEEIDHAIEEVRHVVQDGVGLDKIILRDT
jgi:hypothetical protein